MWARIQNNKISLILQSTSSLLRILYFIQPVSKCSLFIYTYVRIFFNPLMQLSYVHQKKVFWVVEASLINLLIEW